LTTDHGGRSLACAAIVACVATAASPAAAGIWTYGCKGNLGDDQIIFDRNCVDYQLTAP
jgi:hypothetical protein